MSGRPESSRPQRDESRLVSHRGNRDGRAVTAICDGACVAVIRWLFDLVIIVGYFATALILGSWIMVAAPFVFATVVVVVTIVRVRLDEP